MRKSARAFVLVVLAILTTAILGVGSAFMSALALGAATALIVPGTGTPNASIVARALFSHTTPSTAFCVLRFQIPELSMFRRWSMPSGPPSALAAPEAKIAIAMQINPARLRV